MFKKTLLYLFNSLLFFVSRFITKNKNIWLFGSWFGDKYADNSRFLFEYLHKEHPEIRAVWITDSDDIVSSLRKEGFEAYKKYSISSVLLGLRAGYSVFVQSNLVDVIPFLNNGKTKLIQLWHGIPLKKIGFDDKYAGMPSLKTRFKYLLFPFLKEFYDVFIANSQEDAERFCSAFNVKKVVVTGYPRNDVLSAIKTTGNYNLFYFPTFRDSIGSEIDLFNYFGFDFESWNSFLGRLNINLYIKMHPVNKPGKDLLSQFENSSNIIFLDELDVADVLPEADVLITDYSSVYFDFLLTEKPIIFSPFDFEKYITKDRELYYPYDEVTPGPKCKDWNEVLNWVVKFKENPSLYSKERENIKNKFHKYDDFKSCERVYQEIIKL